MSSTYEIYVLASLVVIDFRLFTYNESLHPVVCIDLANLHVDLVCII